MSAHKLNQVKINLIQLIALVILFFTFAQAVPNPTLLFEDGSYSQAPPVVVDGGHTIDVG
jgi:hypothetical protein